MAQHVIIDGNNLLYAMHAHAPLPQVGRETLVKVIERWAGQGDDDVTLVFDGPVPREGLARQMTSSRITVRFSAPVTADDVIVSLVHRTKDPGTVRVVSSDTAIRREAKYRRCLTTDVVTFVAELFPGPGESKPAPPGSVEKPENVSPEETREWLELFGFEDSDDEPFEGYDTMRE
ncbi:MAG: NYN domain-containing protein [Phycisphaerae bacterium]